ncbi:MAG: glycosyltransferase family 4 protein [Bacteroidales bacterium]|nr:glycosyltransferase family 4 protein [Bacteroidales bacterium]
MKILYLYSEIMGYQMPILKQYVEKYNAEVHVIHWDHKKLTPYVPPIIENVLFYSRSKYNTKELVKFVSKLNPDIIYISGWMDKSYLAAVFQIRKRGIPVVTMFDDIWFKTLRQKIASLFFPYIKKYFFSHAWVAGPYQYEYAKRLGFKNTEIIHNSLSADLNLFNEVYERNINNKVKNIPHSFLYVGRFEDIKGVDILVKAWDNLKKSELTKDWELTIIGNGSLKNQLSHYSSVQILDFMQPEQLREKIGEYGCFVLPSRKEQWSLVLHEFSAAGMPIICSDICGAAPYFVIPGFNGYTFRKCDVCDLQEKMLKIINLTDQQLLDMSFNSHNIGQKISPEISAASFMSILK